MRFRLLLAGVLTAVGIGFPTNQARAENPLETFLLTYGAVLDNRSAVADAQFSAQTSKYVLRLAQVLPGSAQTTTRDEAQFRRVFAEGVLVRSDPAAWMRSPLGVAAQRAHDSLQFSDPALLETLLPGIAEIDGDTLVERLVTYIDADSSHEGNVVRFTSSIIFGLIACAPCSDDHLNALTGMFRELETPYTDPEGRQFEMALGSLEAAAALLVIAKNADDAETIITADGGSKVSLERFLSAVAYASVDARATFGGPNRQYSLLWITADPIVPLDRAIVRAIDYATAESSPMSLLEPAFAALIEQRFRERTDLSREDVDTIVRDAVARYRDGVASEN